jgi:hypothetical protein
MVTPPPRPNLDIWRTLNIGKKEREPNINMNNKNNFKTPFLYSELYLSDPQQVLNSFDCKFVSKSPPQRKILAARMGSTCFLIRARKLLHFSGKIPWKMFLLQSSKNKGEIALILQKEIMRIRDVTCNQ